VAAVVVPTLVVVVVVVVFVLVLSPPSPQGHCWALLWAMVVPVRQADFLVPVLRGQMVEAQVWEQLRQPVAVLVEIGIIAQD
jgi:hypothetical protein